ALTEIIKVLVFSHPDSALGFVEEFRAIAEKSGTTLQKAKGHNLAGMCFSVKSEYGTALPHYMSALDGFEKAGDAWYVAMLHNNIGSVHKEENRLDMAEREITAALNGFMAISDTLWTAIMWNNLANILRARNLPDSASVYYGRAVALLEGVNAAEHAASIRYNQGTVEGDRGRHRDALPLYRDALRILGDRPEDHLRSMVLTEIGMSSLEVDSLPGALQALREALVLSTAGGFKKQRASVHRGLAAYYERTGRLDSALVHQRAFTQWNDSVYSEEKSAQINELQEKYDSGKKDALIAENKAQLEQRALTIKAIAGGAVLLLLAAVFAFRAYRSKRKGEAEVKRQKLVIEGQLKEKELLLREIHHRVKNNLQTVSSLLSIQGRGITDEAAKQAVNESRLRVKSMALIHQDLYREGDLTGVQMPDYVTKLATGLVTSYGMSDRVVLDLRLQSINLDVDTAVPIGLILNELITNALKYAWPEGRTGSLTVAMSEADGALVITVADDGIGIQDSSSVANGGTGFGLGMIRTFASKLKAEHTITGSNGTTVRLVVRNYKRTA
ncbi:MAG: tetratricopeptide repeat protein, partial [Flavobacteriales bacterium]|nr:tetratricopeptide repeat protein [Flavobacteriales bacterium]